MTADPSRSARLPAVRDRRPLPHLRRNGRARAVAGLEPSRRRRSSPTSSRWRRSPDRSPRRVTRILHGKVVGMAVRAAGGLPQRPVLVDRRRPDRLWSGQGARRRHDGVGSVPRLRAGATRRAARAGRSSRPREPASHRHSHTRRSSSRSRPRIRRRRWRSSSSPAGRRRRACGGSALALAACVLGYLAKDQLAVLFAALALTVLASSRGSPRRMHAFRATWSESDWVGAAVLAVGAVIIANAYIAHRSTSWYVSTAFFKDRMLDYGLWAAGALTIGVGIVPTIAGLASLVRPRGEERRPGVQALAVVTAGSGGRLRVLHRRQGRVPVDRLRDAHARAQPHLPASHSCSQERRCSSSAAAAVPGRLSRPAASSLYLVRGTPYGLTAVPELRGARTGDRRLRKPHLPLADLHDRARAHSGDDRGDHPPRPGLADPGPGGDRPRHGARSDDARLDDNSRGLRGARREPVRASACTARCPSPPTGSTARPARSPVIFLGHAVSDPNPVHLLEFWNRAVTGVWSLDGTALSPGRDADAQPRAIGRDTHAASHRLRPDGAGGRHRRTPDRTDRSAVTSS